MKITSYMGIYRDGQYEQPVHIVDDDGLIYDKTLYFKARPVEKEITDSVNSWLQLMKNKPIEPVSETLVKSEVEAVLRAKNVLKEDEKWDDYAKSVVAQKIEEVSSEIDEITKN